MSDQPTPPTPELPRGVQTSEFWMTVLPVIFGLSMICYGTYAAKTEMVNAGTALAGLTTGTYAIGRAIIKR